MFKICKHQLCMALISIRLYISLFIGCAIHIVSIMPLFEYAQRVGRPLSLLEGYVYFSCERYAVSAVFLCIAFLVSDIPFTSENETYTLMRTSRRKWLAGKILYLLFVCCLYYFVLFLIGMGFLSNNAYAGNFWSEPFYYLNCGMGVEENSAYFPYTHILQLSPLKAVFTGMTLNIAYGFTMSLILFFCDLKLPRTLGCAVTMLFHAAFYMILSIFQTTYYIRYSLLGNCLLMYHNIYGEYEKLLPTFVQSFIVFGIVTVSLILLIFREILKYDFRITAGAKE